MTRTSTANPAARPRRARARRGPLGGGSARSAEPSRRARSARPARPRVPPKGGPAVCRPAAARTPGGMMRPARRPGDHGRTGPAGGTSTWNHDSGPSSRSTRAGLLQGLSLVAVPAAASVLTSSVGVRPVLERVRAPLPPAGRSSPSSASVGLPGAGAPVRPQTGAPGGPRRQHGGDDTARVSNAVQGDAAAFPMLLVSTAALGLGFGLTLGSLSTYAGAFHPQRREVALTALNVLLGLGTALSPLLIAVFLDVGEWWYLPLAAAVGLAVVLVVARRPTDGHRRDPGVAGGTAGSAVPRLFWPSPPHSCSTGRRRRCSATGARPCSHDGWRRLGDVRPRRVLGGRHRRPAGDRGRVGAASTPSASTWRCRGSSP